MKYIKLFESFDRSLFKLYQRDDYIKFDAERGIEDITDSELSTLKEIFNQDDLVIDKSKYIYANASPDRKISVIRICKYNDDYWGVFLIKDKPGGTDYEEKFAICDTLDGVEEFRNSEDYDPS